MPSQTVILAFLWLAILTGCIRWCLNLTWLGTYTWQSQKQLEFFLAHVDRARPGDQFDRFMVYQGVDCFRAPMEAADSPHRSRQMQAVCVGKNRTNQSVGGSRLHMCTHSLAVTRINLPVQQRRFKPPDLLLHLPSTTGCSGGAHVPETQGLNKSLSLPRLVVYSVRPGPTPTWRRKAADGVPRRPPSAHVRRTAFPVPPNRFDAFLYTRLDAASDSAA